jgi:hypothetical protein
MILRVGLGPPVSARAHRSIQMAMSPELTKALSKTPAADGTVHITRGDGDGCINL